MATTKRRAMPDLAGEPGDPHPGNDDFFQMVRLAERRERSRRPGQDSIRVGIDGPPGREPLRFHAVNNLAFPYAAVQRLSERRDAGTTDGCPYRMDVSFMGLTGPSGVMPQHYTALVQARLKQRDTTLADFLDLFNHRLVSLYYRAWAKYRLVIQEENHAAGNAINPFTQVLGALAGQMPGQGDETGLYYAGHYARRNRSATTLRRMLEDFLEHPVQVESFVGQWLRLERRDMLRIGSADNGRNNRFGNGILAGRRVWDIQSRCRIHIGPLSAGEYEALLPDSARFHALQRLIRAYTPGHLDVELRFAIHETDLNHRRRLNDGIRLGWNAWLQSAPPGFRHANRRLDNN